MKIFSLAVLLPLTLLISLHTKSCKASVDAAPKPMYQPGAGIEKAYFASGCFWCVEAIFETVYGVEEVVSGYAGGTADDANYDAVSSGATNHAESVEVFYDPNKISYSTLL